jgi:limonene-1,2-epoxide hydrolase
MQPREIVQAALEALDEPGGEGYADRFAEDAEMTNPLGTMHGREEIRAFVRGMHASFTDWAHEATFDEIGELVVVEGTWSGTHTSPMRTPQGEVPATGRRATIPFAGLVRVRDGEIVSLHNYFDQMTFMGQLGLLPEPATAS